MVKGSHHTEATKRKISKNHRGSKYFLGKHLSVEHRRKISESRLGMVFSQKHKENIGKASKAAWTLKRRKLVSLRLTGRHLSEEHKRKIAESLRGKLVGRVLSEEHKRKIGLKSKGRIPSPETRRKMSEALKGRKLTEEAKCKIRLHNRTKELWQDPKYRKRQLKALVRGQSNKPTRPEKKLQSLLDKLFYKQYKYVGDGAVWIGFTNPDFININGQKKVIELFGEYWHSRKVTGISNTEHRRRRERLFAKYGYSTLVIWEWELQDLPKLTKKLEKFHGSLCEVDRKSKYA